MGKLVVEVKTQNSVSFVFCNVQKVVLGGRLGAI